MLNPLLTKNVVASLEAAGITPPKLPAPRQLPLPRTSVDELTDLVLASTHEDPYEDPKVVATASKLYLQSMVHLNAGNDQRELMRQAKALEAHKDTILEQIQEAFTVAAAKLQETAEPLKNYPDPNTIDPAGSSRQLSEAAASVGHDLLALERVIKAWKDLWAALGVSQPRDIARPFIFMNPNAQTWTGIQLNPTIWEAVRHGEPLTLAETPQHANERHQAMWDNEEAARDGIKAAFHRKNGAALVEAYRS